MKIKKLTITPVTRGCQPLIKRKPRIEEASILISGRLFCFDNMYNRKIPRALRKIPKYLKGFVDPKTLVVKERKFDVAEYEKAQADYFQYLTNSKH